MPAYERELNLRADGLELVGDLAMPSEARGAVVFAHGSGSSRRSPRNRHVAAALNDAGFATLLFDLLTPDEERIDARTAELRFDIPMLARRMTGAIDWTLECDELRGLPIGAFGASTGAAAALVAAAQRPDAVGAVVSRGGRPDLAGAALPGVSAPTLLIVGGADGRVLELNEMAREDLAGLAPEHRQLAIVPGATHLFEEPGALESVEALASAWFQRHLSAAPTARAGSSRP